MRRHWVLTTWNAQAMAGFPASIAAPLARCALWSRSLAVHLAVRDKGVLWIGIDSSERREPPDHTAAPGGCHLAGQKSPGALVGLRPLSAVGKRIQGHRRRARLWCAVCVTPP